MYQSVDTNVETAATIEQFQVFADASGIAGLISYRGFRYSVTAGLVDVITPDLHLINEGDRTLRGNRQSVRVVREAVRDLVARNCSREWLKANREMYREELERRALADGCQHESTTTPDGHGAYCQHCGEVTA